MSRQQLDPEPTESEPTESTWGQRHAVTIMTIVMFGLLAMVTIIQVAC